LGGCVLSQVGSSWVICLYDNSLMSLPDHHLSCLIINSFFFFFSSNSVNYRVITVGTF
jgi:hypothetical protein